MKQHKDLAALTPWKHEWQIPRHFKLIPRVVTQCIRGTWVASTIETSVVTWHKTHDSTLNIYRRPNPNLQIIRCLCVAVSLYSTLRAEDFRLKMTKKVWSNPYTDLSLPWWFQEFYGPRFQYGQHIKFVSLLALRTGCIYPTRNYSWRSFQLEAE